MIIFGPIFGVLVFSGVNSMDASTFRKFARNSTENSNEQCSTQIWLFFSAILNGDLWAYKMLDSSGSIIPTGMHIGNTLSMGFYDECVGIAEEVGDQVIKGKFCLGGLVIPYFLLNQSDGDIDYKTAEEGTVANIAHLQLLNMERRNPRSDKVTLPEYTLTSVCIPHECMASDVFGALGIDDACTVDENIELDGGDIAFIVFIVIIVKAMCLSTAYDLYITKKQKKSAHPILTAFSVYSNGNKIFQTGNSREQIQCFHGMKAMSLFWVICLHRYGLIYDKIVNINNVHYKEEWENRWYAMYATMGDFAVDTFLYIAGVLISYNFLKDMTRPGAKFNIFLYYIHRILRIMPAVAVLFFYQVTIARRLSSGPLWKNLFEEIRDQCLKNWLSTFFYYQNYMPDGTSCMLHLWYLSLDMHAFLLSPLLLLPLVKYPRLGKRLVLPLAILVAVLTPIIIIYKSNGYDGTAYYFTHMRISPWVIGLVFGSFLWSSRNKTIKLKRYVAFFMWIVVLTALAVILWIKDPVEDADNRIAKTFYFGLRLPIWAVCLCWITFACIYGYGGIINTFLSCGAFQVISKLSYTMYVMHASWILIPIGRTRVQYYFDDINGLYNVCGDIFFVFLVGLFWTLAFESPVITIEKVIFRRGSRSGHQKTETKEVNASAVTNSSDIEKGTPKMI